MASGEEDYAFCSPIIYNTCQVVMRPGSFSAFH